MRTCVLVFFVHMCVSLACLKKRGRKVHVCVCVLVRVRVCVCVCSCVCHVDELVKD